MRYKYKFGAWLGFTFNRLTDDEGQNLLFECYKTGEYRLVTINGETHRMIVRKLFKWSSGRYTAILTS